MLAALNQSWSHLRNNLSSTSCIADEIINIDKGVKADFTCRIQPFNYHKTILFDDLLEVICYFSILLAHAWIIWLGEELVHRHLFVLIKRMRKRLVWVKWVVTNLPLHFQELIGVRRNCFVLHHFNRISSGFEACIALFAILVHEGVREISAFIESGVQMIIDFHLFMFIGIARSVSRLNKLRYSSDVGSWLTFIILYAISQEIRPECFANLWSLIQSCIHQAAAPLTAIKPIIISRARSFGQRHGSCLNPVPDALIGEAICDGAFWVACSGQFHICQWLIQGNGACVILYAPS